MNRRAVLSNGRVNHGLGYQRATQAIEDLEDKALSMGWPNCGGGIQNSTGMTDLTSNIGRSSETEWCKITHQDGSIPVEIHGNIGSRVDRLFLSVYHTDVNRD